MRRAYTLILLLLLSLSALAQSPEAIREAIRKYPNLALPTYSTYPSVPLGEIAPTPEGFEPFYFSLVGRHGSRYDQTGSRFNKALSVFRKADSLGILTEDGKHLYSHIVAIAEAQKGRNGEISALGYQQWLGIAHRAYSHFSPIFASGAVEAKSSSSLRCVFSMSAFNQGLKECNPKLEVAQNARKLDLPVVRPLFDHPATPEVAKKLSKDYELRGEWLKVRDEWSRGCDASSFISKVTTDSKRFLNECGGKNDFRVSRYSFTTLLFAENFEMGDRELLNTLFTPEEMYNMYVYNTAFWVHTASAIDNDIVAMFASYMRPLIEDIMNGASDAIKGKNPHCANSRFTHDTYMTPLFSVMGYEGCVAKSTGDLETDTTSFNLGELVSMAANLQIILYRNKQGKILVRSLINERDGYLPIKCETAPFYPWDEFCKYINDNLNALDKARDRILNNVKK